MILPARITKIFDRSTMRQRTYLIFGIRYGGNSITKYDDAPLITNFLRIHAAVNAITMPIKYIENIASP